MIRRFTGLGALIFLMGFVFPHLCFAITITAPKSVQVGQPVIVAVQSSAQDNFQGCAIVLDFGDGTQSFQGPNCPIGTTNCGFTTSHTYQQAGTYTLAASVQCPQSGSSAPLATRTITVVDLSVQRMDLYFNNHQPKINVKQYQRDLKAFAEIRYSGSGLLHGQWEIDGRLFFKVRKQLYRGQQKIVLQTPLAPPLPTYSVGSHHVRFVITQPEGRLDPPRAIYFVTADAAQFQSTIELLSPPDDASLSCDAIVFRWEVNPKAYVYLVEFVGAGGDDPIFSAYAKKNEYTLQGQVCQSLFSVGRTYHWRVKALSQEGQVIDQSKAHGLALTQ